MKKEHAINFINAGKRLGVELDTDSDYICWIEVRKLFVNQRILDLFADEPETHEYKAQKLTWEKPYCITVTELRNDVFESNIWPSKEHYRRNDIYRFYNLYEVEAFLQTLGKNFTDLKWPVDYDHF